ncbi:MAG: hypothetical protein WAU58_00040 [Terriglobales bacterium]
MNRAPFRLVALVLLLTVGPLLTTFSPLTALLNGDIFWHVRSGVWILQAHAVPRTGLFSQYPDRYWADCSWGFDVVAAGVYKLLGLRGFAELLMAFRLALAGVTFLVAGGRRGCFWCAVALSAIAQYVLTDLALRPNLFSMLMFGILLYLLIKSRRSHASRVLLFLPLLFLVWANLDAQFLNGLLLLAVYVVAEIADGLFRQPLVPANSMPRVVGIAALCVVATFLTPYTFWLFSGAAENAYGKVLYDNFQEMQAMAFRRPQDFALLLLVMGAFLALGRQQSRDLFKIGALGVFTMLTFRLQRDAWCVVLPAVAVIGDALTEWRWKSEEQTADDPRQWEKPVVAVLVLVVLIVAIVRLPNDAAMMKQAERAFPVKACDYIRANQLPGPMFNTYYWGSFLTWYLPEYPVSIDSRLNLYGDEITDRYFKVSTGNQRLETDPSFTGARIILLERSSGMLKALTTLPALKDQFRVAYQDNVASVLVRQ